MVKQYPHTLKIAVAATATENSNGDFVTTPASELHMEGRYEASSGNALIQAPNGTMVNYSGIVYIPYPENPIALGTVVEVYNSRENLVAKGTVKLYLEGEVLRKSARLWLG